jgi:DNA-binding NtrC family response regulator
MDKKMAKILFVDDEIEFLDFMKSYFEEQGHEVLTTLYGHEGLKLILEEKPDIAIIDARLKDDLDGMNLIKRAHAQAPEQKMILCTGFKDPDMDAEAIRNGASLCLHKPMSGLTQLEEVIFSVIGKKN